jgi:aspartate dehydrogenase
MIRTTPLAIARLGAIGGRLARELLAGGIPGFRLTAVAVRNVDKARVVLDFKGEELLILPLEELTHTADILVECVPSSAFDKVAKPVIEADKILIVMTGSALIERQSLIDRAHETGAGILVPSGAMLGLEALNTVAEGKIYSVVIVTRKPPNGLQGSAYLKKNNIDLSNIDTPVYIFAGSVREAAIHFPANVNIAASLSLAGIGPDHTKLEIWADPTIERNTPSVTVKSDSSNFPLQVQNIPSDENPRTGRITPQSVIALLRGLSSPLKVGT